MEVKKEITSSENVSTALLTAGTIFIIACSLKQSFLRFLIDQWRAWIFLLLNIILLAIFFTSTYYSTTHHHQETSYNNNKPSTVIDRIETKRKRRKQYSSLSVEVDDDDKRKSSSTTSICDREDIIVKEQKNVNNIVEDDDQNYSKEELNERVEAFITMFRQHLIADAKSISTKLPTLDVQIKAQNQNLMNVKVGQPLIREHFIY
ncbi:hypothetical protein ACFE04_007247 [Oxalis oulophora]